MQVPLEGEVNPYLCEIKMPDCTVAISGRRIEMAACLCADRWQWTAGFAEELSVEETGGLALFVVDFWCRILYASASIVTNIMKEFEVHC